MRESKIEKDCCKLAKKWGCLVFKFTSPGNKGVPDRLFINPKGETFYVEFKRPGEKLRPIQEYQIGRLKEHGVRVYVCDNVDIFVDILANEI